VPEILALQKVASQSEAEMYGDESLPALHQSLEEMEADFERMVFLKAVVNGKTIGAVRGYALEETAYISRLIVHPYFRGRGLGIRLVTEIEQVFPGVQRFEAFTGHRSQRNLHVYDKLGYRTFRTEPFTPAIQWVHVRKERA
jgi:ribosomal protein S18 acetylase RimI-like enzyme